MLTGCVTPGYSSYNETKKQDETALESMVSKAMAAIVAANENKEYWPTGCSLLNSKNNGFVKNGEKSKFLRAEPYEHQTTYVSRRSPTTIRVNGIFAQEGGVEFKAPFEAKYSFDGSAVSVMQEPKLWLHEKCMKLSDPLVKFRKDKKLLKAINDGWFFIGMSEEALLLSQGEMKANISNIRGRRHIQYVNGKDYFYVENGKLVSYQLN